MSAVILIGAGGQCKSLIPIVDSIYDMIQGIMSANKEDIGKTVLGFPINCTDLDMERLKEDHEFVIAIGQTPMNPFGRKMMFERLKSIDARIATIQSKCSVVHGSLETGAIIHDMAFVNVDSVIGENTIINTGAIIEHDVIIGKHCHICPGATVIGGISICDETIIGAGSVVVQNITEPGFYGGVPARPILLKEAKADIKIVPPSAMGGLNAKH